MTRKGTRRLLTAAVPMAPGILWGSTSLDAQLCVGDREAGGNGMLYHRHVFRAFLFSPRDNGTQRQFQAYINGAVQESVGKQMPTLFA